MHKDILLKDLKTTPIYSVLTSHFKRHSTKNAENYNIVEILTHVALHESNEYCSAFAKHLHHALALLKPIEYQRIIDQINKDLLPVLFRKGLLFAINEYIRVFPIPLTHQNNEGDTIVHQLAKACKQIYDYPYNGSVDDEIDNGAFLFDQMECAKAIWNYLKEGAKAKTKEREEERKEEREEEENIINLLRTEGYLFNKKEESALLILLTGYKRNPYSDFSEKTDIPLLNDLLIIYPKEIIKKLYQKLCLDTNNPSRNFSKNIFKDALLSKYIIKERLDFHKNPAEKISEEDLDFYENTSELILQHIISSDDEDFFPLTLTCKRTLSWAEPEPSPSYPSPKCSSMPTMSTMPTVFKF